MSGIDIGIRPDDAFRRYVRRPVAGPLPPVVDVHGGLDAAGLADGTERGPSPLTAIDSEALPRWRIAAPTNKRLAHRHRSRGVRRSEAIVAWLAPLSIDVTGLATAWLLVAILERHAPLPSGLLGWPSFLLLVLAALAWRRMYARHRASHPLDELASALLATLLAAMTTLWLRPLVGLDPPNSRSVTLLALLAACLLTVGRAALKAAIAATGREFRGCPTLVIGAGRVGQLAAKRLLAKPELGMRPIGFVDDDPPQDGSLSAGLPMMGSTQQLERAVAMNGVQHVVVAFTTAPDHTVVNLVRRCSDLNLSVWLVPRLFEARCAWLGAKHVGALPLVETRAVDPASWRFTVKYLLERLVALVLLTLAAPLLVFAAAAVRVTLGSPVFFSQRRVGFQGTEFDLLKLRTMNGCSSPAAVDNGHLTDDLAPGGVEERDRRTRLGAFLRRTSIDELPQLVNVLRGEMSLIGPRPERPEFVRLYAGRIPRYLDRLRVRPGITGWAQVNGLRGRTSISDRVEWDNYYIENWSPSLDLKTFLMTVPCVWHGNGEGRPALD